jgi:hypothetical protein
MRGKPHICKVCENLVGASESRIDNTLRHKRRYYSITGAIRATGGTNVSILTTRDTITTL